MTTCEAVHIPLDSAYLCTDCHAVGNNHSQCPACASAAVMSLANVLDRKPDERLGERAA